MNRTCTIGALSIIVIIVTLMFAASEYGSDSADADATPCGDNLLYEYDEVNQTVRLFLSEGATTANMWTMNEYPWSDRGNQSKISLPEGLTNISDRAFFNFSAAQLDGGRIPSTVASIGYQSFRGCQGIGSITLPEGIVEIGAYAFDGCTGITGQIKFPYSTSIIDAYAFKGCTGLSGTLTVPSGIIELRDCAFQGCTGLETIDIMAGCEGLSPNSFSGFTFYEEDKTTEITSRDEGFIGFIFQKEGDKMIRNGEDSSHAVKYDTNGGLGPKPIQCRQRQGDIFTVKDYSGTKIGFQLGGWLYDTVIYQPGDRITMGDHDIVLTAVWLRAHQVLYDIQGGTGPAPQQDPVRENWDFTVQEYSGTKIGCVFKGWMYNGQMYHAGDKITMHQSNITLTAEWWTTHTVTYFTNGGSERAPEQDDVFQGETFRLKPYSGTKEGYEFRGWMYNGYLYNPDDIITMGAYDIILGARWIPVFHVTYDLNGGSGEAPTQADVAEGSRIIVKGCTAVKEGFDFNGWKYGQELYFESDMILMQSSDIVLVANWIRTPDSHHVTYDLNGGSGEAPTQEDVKEGCTFLVKMYQGDKDGRAFKGWYYGGHIYQMGASIVMQKKDITLVAVWEKDDFVSANIGIIIGAAFIVVLAAIGTALMVRKSRNRDDTSKEF